MWNERKAAMAKPKNPPQDEKPTAQKSILFSSALLLFVFGAGMVSFFVLQQIGGRVTKMNAGPFEVEFPTAAPGLAASSAPGDPLRLEDHVFWVFSYGFGNDFHPPQHYSSLVAVNNPGTGISYKTSFSIPLQGDAAAGVSFTLAEPLNLKSYSTLEITASFNRASCDLFMKDPSGGSAFVTIFQDAPPDIQPELISGKWHFQIPMSNYSSINLASVKEIGCNAQRCEGDCEFELGDIEFR
jgi:hypothetical protein